MLSEKFKDDIGKIYGSGRFALLNLIEAWRFCLSFCVLAFASRESACRRDLCASRPGGI